MNRILGLCLWVGLVTALAPPAAGGLSVSPDGRQLINANGDAVFLNAATPWHLLARLDRPETIQYLDARRARGFNALLLSILVNEDFQTGSFDNAYGEPPFLVDNDFSQPNEAYFAHVDWFMEEATRRGFFILLEPAYIGWECRTEGFCQAMEQNGVETLREYGRWLGTRYGNYENLIWVNGGDADAAAYDAMDVVDAVAEGILETSPDQLHSAHCKRQLSAVDCFDRPWLDINNTYSDCQSTPEKLRADWNRSPTQPFFYIEGYYEGEHDTSDVCLRSQAYWSLLGGAMGHCFGNRPMWDFWDGWEQALDSEGSRSMEHFGSLLQSRGWSQLQPDWNHDVLVAGYGSLTDGSHAAAARTANGNTVMVYTPDSRTLTLNMGQVSGEKAAAWWFNPGNGTTVFIETTPTIGWREYTPPFGGDWVLVLDNESAELPAPGQGVGTEPRSSATTLKARFWRTR